jgi:hypothetical protein
MADFNVSSFSSGSNPLDGGSSMGGNIMGGSSNTFDDTSTSYQGRSSSTGGGLGQSPWGRLTEVLGDDANLGTLFSGVGSESGGGNPFPDNPAAAQVLFSGDSQGGSPFTNLRSNIDKLVSSSTNGSNPMGGSGITSQSADSFDLASYGIPTNGSFDLASYGIPSAESGGEASGLSDPFAPGGAFGIPSADSFDLASYGIPTDGSFDLASYGIPTNGSFGGASGGAIPIEGGGIGGAGGGMPSFGGAGGGMPSFGGGIPFA